MKYRITTHYNPGILDNAGKAVTHSLQSLGFDEVKNVKIGEIYEVDCPSKDIENVAKSLTNEVMKFYTIQGIL